MKIQIDTNTKVIRLLESANFSRFVKFAKKLLAEEYEQFTLECTTEHVYWNNPIYIPTVRYIPNPWAWPTITCGSGNTPDLYNSLTATTGQGVYCLDVQEVEEPIKN